MTVRDIAHARDTTAALVTFLEALQDDDEVGEEGMSARDVQEALKYARALHRCLTA
jgi:hypothetical protein